jgi:hypothetical protein
VFLSDLELCPTSGRGLKIMAANLENPVIEKLLTHLGLPAPAPPRAPAAAWSVWRKSGNPGHRNLSSSMLDPYKFDVETATSSF